MASANANGVGLARVVYSPSLVDRCSCSRIECAVASRVTKYIVCRLSVVQSTRDISPVLFKGGAREQLETCGSLVHEYLCLEKKCCASIRTVFCSSVRDGEKRFRFQKKSVLIDLEVSMPIFIDPRIFSRMKSYRPGLSRQ